MKAALFTLCSVVAASAVAAPAAQCVARSPATLTPVVEVYTSEGCSSCPPTDKWLTKLRDDAEKGRVVPQGFHVGYWDYIGWVDRFANPAHTDKQRQVASWNRLTSIYTPQIVRNGQDWRDERVVLAPEPAKAAIEIQRNGDDAFAANVTPTESVGSWAAYWTVTEHGHSSKVRAGENAGEFLKHDFVVRQYVPVGDRRGPASLTLRTIAANAAHPRQVNLVVFDPKNGKTLQALSLHCGA